MSRGETNSDAKDEQHSAKVYGGKLILHKLAEYYMPQVVLCMQTIWHYIPWYCVSILPALVGCIGY